MIKREKNSRFNKIKTYKLKLSVLETLQYEITKVNGFEKIDIVGS